MGPLCHHRRANRIRGGHSSTAESTYGRDAKKRGCFNEARLELLAIGHTDERSMNTADVPPGAEIPRDGAAPATAPAPPAVLHGRLLNVSRMATIGEMAAGV